MGRDPLRARPRPKRGNFQRHRPRWAGLIATGVLVAAIALVAAACGSSTPSVEPSTTPGLDRPSSSPASPPGSAEPSLTPVPGGATPGPPTEPPTPVTTTETDWGIILDRVPAAFPRFPGSAPAEISEGPASDVLLAPADVDTVSSWYQGTLATVGYATLAVSGPYEDGSRVIDEAMGSAPDCRVQLALRPEAGSTLVTILYGAGCPSGG